MALVTLDEIRDELPTVTISAAGTTPTEAQAERMITRVEGDIRALVSGYGVPWPTDPDSDAATYLRATIIEGAKCLILRAKHAQTVGDKRPDEIELTCDDYNRRTKDIKTIIAGLRQATASSPGGGIAIPLYSRTDRPILAGTFDEWTQYVDRESGRGGWLVST